MAENTKNKFIPYGHQSIDKDDIKAMVEVLKGDWLTCGPKVLEFEGKLARYSGAKYAVAVSSGSTALSLAYLAAGIGNGDEVITTPLTFAATSNCLVHLGAKPVFVDIEADIFNIDPELVERAITKKTKAIAIVDFGGHPCDFDKIKAIARKYRLLIIEDAAHAVGSKYKGKKVGSLAGLTIFSFHPVKTMTTAEGGAVLTNSKEFYDKMKMLRHHGVEKKPEKGGWYYEINQPGYNYRITDIQCALGISQLKKLDKFIKRRREIVEKYNFAFADLKNIILPVEKSYAQSSWHIYPIQIKTGDRQEIFDKFKEEGIGVQVHYIPLHLQPFYQTKFGYKQGDFPVAEKYYNRAITLPLYPAMTEEQIAKVIKVVKEII